MNQLFIQTLAQCIFSYMKAENITSIAEFNEKNNFTPLKTALLPFLVATASENINTGFELYQPWKLEQIIPRDVIHQPDVLWRRTYFHSSKVVPFIDFPSSIVDINYASRYLTIVPANYIAATKEFFSE